MLQSQQLEPEFLSVNEFPLRIKHPGLHGGMLPKAHPTLKSCKVIPFPVATNRLGQGG